ncbi:phosphotransferase [Nocardia tengchongensis]|uniref:phosphotransferase n=1 Tax=Nocardia tengchongensis TaxID=2055889 RepID=UPI0036BD6A97
MLFTLDRHGWFVVVFEFVDGRHPDLSRPAELRAVLALLARMAEALTPSPLAGIPTVAEKFGTVLRSWSRFAEQGAPPDLNRWALRNLERLADLETGWLDRSGGETLLHTNLRPDNLLIDAGGSVSVVDWAWRCRGAAWLDLAALAPAIALCALVGAVPSAGTAAFPGVALVSGPRGPDVAGLARVPNRVVLMDTREAMATRPG